MSGSACCAKMALRLRGVALGRTKSTAGDRRLSSLRAASSRPRSTIGRVFPGMTAREVACCSACAAFVPRRPRACSSPRTQNASCSRRKPSFGKPILRPRSLGIRCKHPPTRLVALSTNSRTTAPALRRCSPGADRRLAAVGQAAARATHARRRDTAAQLCLQREHGEASKR